MCQANSMSPIKTVSHKPSVVRVSSSFSTSNNNNIVGIALPAAIGVLVLTMMAILTTASVSMHQFLPSNYDGSILFSETNMMIMTNSSSLLMIISSVIGAAMIYYYYYMSATIVLSGRAPKKVLPLTDYQPIPLLRKEILSHDTRRFTFGLPSGHVLGLPTGQHVSLKFTTTVVDEVTGQKINKPIIRSYTPVTDDTTATGEFSLVIKVYRPMPPKFPIGGYMSQYLDDLNVGDMILMKGPKGHVHYTNKTNDKNNSMMTSFTVKPIGKPIEIRNAQYYGMMAGGTGITPMLQVLNCIFRHIDANPNICVKLIYANQTIHDILVRTELELLQQDFPTRFHLYYTIDQVSLPPPTTRMNDDNQTDKEEKKTWEYGIGFITKEMIQQHLLFTNTKKDNTADNDHVGKQQQFFMCGPPPMIKFACLPALTELGFTEKDWVVF